MDRGGVRSARRADHRASGVGIVHSGSALAALGAALSFTVYQLITRRLAGTDHPVTSNYLTSLVGCVALSVLVIFNWRTPTLHARC